MKRDANVILFTLLSTLICSVVSGLVMYGFVATLSLGTVETRALTGLAVTFPLLITPFLAVMWTRKNDELEEAQEEIHRLGISDALTGLYKRHYFFEFAQKELLAATRYHYPISLLLLDVDNFKRINARHGHEVGDHTLRNVARVIQDSMRETDFLARFGGEEFAILMPHAKWEDAEATAERVRTAMESLQTLSGGNQVFVTVSIGLASLGTEASNLEQLVAKAELALLHAKKTAGGNHVSVAEALPEIVL